MGMWSRFRLLFRMKADSALDRAENPQQVFDYAYSQQQELLRNVRRGLIEVATAKRRLERQSEKLIARVPQLDDRAKKAIDADREDLARLAVQRKHTVTAEIEGLNGQLAEVAEEEARMVAAEQKLAARTEEFRTRRDVLSARHSAAEAQVKASEAVTGVSSELAEVTKALGRAEEKTERMQARAFAIGELIESGSLALPGSADDDVDGVLREIAVEEELQSFRELLGKGRQPLALPNEADKGERHDD